MKKQNYILKDEEIFVGLEDSKKTWQLCIRSGGMVIRETAMPADYEVLKNYLKNNFPKCAINVMYEAGFRGFGLHDSLKSDGWNCVVTPPHTVTEEKVSSQKNDILDARRLAKNLENKDYKSCFVPDQELREDRQISRIYGQIQKDIIRMSNRIRRTLDFHGLDKHFKAGAWRQRDYKEMKIKLKTLKLSESLKYSFNLLQEKLEYLWLKKKEVLKKLSEFFKSRKYKESAELLFSAPGIGKLTSIRLVLEWGNIARFKAKEQFANFLGLVPNEHSSGETVRKGHITKQGSGAVRSWLIEAAWVAIRYDEILLKKFKEIFKRCNCKKKAIIAVARKLGLRLRALLINKTPYVTGVIE